MRPFYFPVVSADWDVESISLDLEPEDSAQQSFLESLSDDLRYVVSYKGQVASCRLLKSEFQNPLQTRLYSVQFQPLKTDFMPARELSLSGIGADDLAELRARRILLNEQEDVPDNSAVSDVDKLTRELFVSGPDTTFPVQSSSFPVLYRQFGRYAQKFLEIAWVDAVARLVLSGCVSTVRRLELSMVGNSLRVSFAGLRKRKFASAIPREIRIEGYCSLVSGADVTGADVDAVQLILERGVKQWNEWRHRHPDANRDLSMADLSGVALSGADFRKVNLRRSNLAGANLSHATLHGADLQRADLHEADLRMADLSGAGLNQANLSGAILVGANLSRTDLSRAGAAAPS